MATIFLFVEKSRYEVRIDLIGSTKYKDIFMNFDFYALSS